MALPVVITSAIAISAFLLRVPVPFKVCNYHTMCARQPLMAGRCSAIRFYSAPEVSLKVLLVDDSPNMQLALRDLFATIPGIHVVGVARSEMEATAWLLSNQGRWHLAVVDLMLDSGTGFNVIPRLKAQRQAGCVLVLSDFATAAGKIRRPLTSVGTRCFCSASQTLSDPFAAVRNRALRILTRRAALLR